MTFRTKEKEDAKLNRAAYRADTSLGKLNCQYYIVPPEPNIDDSCIEEKWVTYPPAFHSKKENIRPISGSNPSKYREWANAGIFSTASRFENKPLERHDVVLLGGNELEIPSALLEIAMAIRNSEYLMDLQFDWDDQGGDAVSKETWGNMSSFLVDYSKWIHKNEGLVLSTPNIMSGPENSIDVLWKNERYRMLINFPPNGEKLAGYYGGDFTNATSIKGKLNLSKIEDFFAVWMKYLTNRSR